MQSVSVAHRGRVGKSASKVELYRSELLNQKGLK